MFVIYVDYTDYLGLYSCVYMYVGMCVVVTNYSYVSDKIRRFNKFPEKHRETRAALMQIRKYVSYERYTNQIDDGLWNGNSDVLELLHLHTK